ncbi:NlpC/P60 family protein [Spirochaeta cellobiosiphila]|uniref:C40 family peptidase n=1 Tax=Spirochaeta cellobiosiphila TaxID=504483 RepID=UPI00041D1891|nr:NlpC/P60 family protein [Spirochaeta cellobiosiphila]
MIEFEQINDSRLWSLADYIVSVPLADLFSEAKENAARVDQVCMGSPLYLLEDHGEWLWLRTYYGYPGWIRSKDIIPCTQDETENLAMVLSSYGDVLREPHYDSPLIECLPASSFILLNGEKKEGWLEVQLLTGGSGWIRTDHIKQLSELTRPMAEDEKRKQIVDKALEFKGVQYRQGGRSLQGMDGSGLCSLVYLLSGSIIYRDAEFKYPFVPVSRDELKPADLIFYSGYVALYLGNNHVLHASGPLGGVGINSLDPKENDFLSLPSLTSYGTFFHPKVMIL